MHPENKIKMKEVRSKPRFAGFVFKALFVCSYFRFCTFEKKILRTISAVLKNNSNHPLFDEAEKFSQ